MSLARTADRHELYEIAVQQPVLMVGFIEHLFAEMVGREPRVLREDFCGTANLASVFVRSGVRRRAVAVDLDRKIIRYAERHNRLPLGPAASRLKLIAADVRRCAARADAIVSLNFSHFIYKTRGDLLAYFKHARRCLNPRGLLILDAYGGPDSYKVGTDKRRFGDFQYLWEQMDFDPITAEVINAIHFKFRDGSRLRDAFVYHWRLWTLAELREALLEAGFKSVRICFETERGFDEKANPIEDDAWVAYLVAQRD